jgi:hypothetical protein
LILIHLAIIVLHHHDNFFTLILHHHDNFLPIVQYAEKCNMVNVICAGARNVTTAAGAARACVALAGTAVGLRSA